MQDGSVTPEITNFIVAEGTGETVTTLVPNFTNLADPTSEEWLSGYRFSSSNGGTPKAATDGGFVTNYIPLKPGDVIRVKGVKGGPSTYFQLVPYNSSGAQKTTAGFFFERTTVQTGNGILNDLTSNDSGVSEWTSFMVAGSQNAYAADCVKARLCGVPVTSEADVIITVNEPITYTEVISGGKTYTLDEKIIVPRANGLKSGAKWFALGDSIVEGWTSAVDTSADSGYKQFLNTNEAEHWVNIVAQLNGYELTNHGAGATGYVYSSNNAKVLVDTIDFSECDFVTLAYGVNDWKYAANVGSEDDIPQTVVATYDAHNSIKVTEDTAADSIVYKNGVLLTPTTDYSISVGYLTLTTDTAKNDMFDIYGAVESMVGNMSYVIKKIIRDNPLCKVFVITPINCRSLGYYSTNWGINYTGTAASGPGLEQIFQLQKAVCEEYGIELIDMTHNSIINRENIKTMLADYVHPTVECHRLMARELAAKISFR